MQCMSPSDELMSLLGEILPKAEFYTRTRHSFWPSDSLSLNSEEFRTEHERVKLNSLSGRRMPLPSDFTESFPDADRFPEEHFARLVATVRQLLSPCIDSDSNRFVGVLPAPRVYHGNLWMSAEQFSKSIVRCAAVFGISETVDTVLRLVEGDTARYTHVVVLDGVSPSSRKEGVKLWPDARLIKWDEAFGDHEGESILGIPDAVLTQADHVDSNAFRFGRSTTLLYIDHTGGPVLRRSADAEPGPGGGFVPVSPHQHSTEIAISALALTVNHPVVEICSWHWYDAKVQYLLGYRNELALDQNMGGPRLMRGRLIAADDASLVRNIHEALSREGMFEELRVPIQRWRRSKAASNGVDLAIDLRIALESLLLDDGNNAELSFRLALRAAWYLGANEDERTKIFNAVRKAYNIGSKAVHTGQGYGDMIPAYLVAVQDICRAAILRRISEGENPPDWKEMVLGN